jgi:hypothetical protein
MSTKSPSREQALAVSASRHMGTSLAPAPGPFTAGINTVSRTVELVEYRLIGSVEDEVVPAVTVRAEAMA